MADTQKSTRTFNALYTYKDGDTRTIKFPNPVAMNTSVADSVKSAVNEFGKITLSDKSSGDTLTGAYVTVSGGSVIEQTTTNLDLTQP